MANLIETGRETLVNSIDDNDVRSITFTEEFVSTPVVIAYMPTDNGDQFTAVRARNVTTTGCEIFHEEPDNQTHTGETIVWMAFEPGVHTIDGVTFEAGRHNTSTVQWSGGGSFDTVSFSHSWSATPVFLHTLNTYANGEMMATAASNIGTASFDVAQEALETGKETGAVAEDIGYVAIEDVGAATVDGVAIEAAVLPGDGTNDGKDDTATTYSFTTAWASTPEVAVGGRTRNGADGFICRGTGNWDTADHAWWAEEDRVADTERGHGDEAYSVFATEPSATITSPPLAPQNVDATYVSDDQVDLSWDQNSSGSEPGSYEIEISRDGGTWVTPAAGSGPSSVSDTTTGVSSHSASYGPDSDQAYGSVVGIDSSFQFRVRAVNSSGASAWTTSDTAYTTPVSPHAPSASRTDGTSITISWTNQSGAQNGTEVQYREDTGTGYGAWTTIETTASTAASVSYNTGTATWFQEDARYQFRLRHVRGTKNSTWVHADYGNSGNVYFEDGFESGGLTNWTTTSLADADSGVQGSTTGLTDAGISGPDEGSYWLRLDDEDYVEKSLGDLSAETDVMVKCAMATGSLDAAAENWSVWWYDGTAWQELTSFSWEYNRQGWVDVAALVPSTWLSTDNRIRLRAGSGFTAGPADNGAFDRVVVSDVLNEYTMPAAPTNLTTDDTVEDQLSISWTHNATFTDRYEPFYRATGAASWTADTNEAATATSHTFTGLADGERYDLKTREVVEQPRHGASNSWWYHDNIHPDGTTVFPVPTLLSSPGHTADSIDLSWTDNADNEDGFRVLLSRSQQSFEGGFGAWTSGAWTLSSTQAYAGTDSAYSDGTGGVNMTAAGITVPTGQMAVDERFYLPVAPGTGNLHLVAYEGVNSWAGPHLSLRNGTLQYHSGGTWYDSGYAPPAGEWVRLAVYIDVANQWFSVTAVDSAGVHQPITEAPFIGSTDSFIAGDSRHLAYGPNEEAYLDAVTEYTDTNTSPAANATTATASGLLNGELYHVALAAYTEHTGVLDN